MEQERRSVAVAVGPKADEQIEREQRERAWVAIQRIGERNVDTVPDEVLRRVTEVVEQVRQERYERAQRESSGDR